MRLSASETSANGGSRQASGSHTALTRQRGALAGRQRLQSISLPQVFFFGCSVFFEFYTLSYKCHFTSIYFLQRQTERTGFIYHAGINSLTSEMLHIDPLEEAFHCGSETGQVHRISRDCEA